MRIDELRPDVAGPAGPARSSESRGFAALIDAAGAQLDRADGAESAFARGRGGMQEMVVERARADIALQVAASGVQRVAQALNSVLGMQI